ncbi:3-hydroxyacyl-CoA dehydrogenase NAD-binding domain-containing protein [Gemmobacter fulvus]|uniref:3-hydroxyacyl-CoA dehydrogenase n=1 Tax=Gemmobacter fulvus TaxID=2840474 RepID=UPI0027964A70|nr:3-hydroxyacyl-CoA dehydrogenase NAD-binding domain-containing protein [Gemmobacter fulvus]MDQ1850685.1 3-hydroxyacyl-CoA dehydrogenase NAD-binding domain-containing protein [Gemmobacter fulvus]
MATIGVVGLGVMGLGIAQVYAQAGHQVWATDAWPEAREAAAQRLRQGMEPRVASGKMAASEMEAILSRIQIGALEALAPCDLIIEAIAEKLDLKQSLFAELETISTATLATNTSSLSVTQIAAGLRDPARVLGLHFFNPAPVMRLVELIALPGTDAARITQARSWTEVAGKTVIACADRPGFIVNRCARPYYGEALALMEEGHSPGEIDAAMVAAGYRLGPFSLMDLVGADINLAATEGLAQAMGNHPRYHVFPALRAQVASGQLGRKTGRGFLHPNPLPAAPPDTAAIALRIEAMLANEAASLLAEGGTTEQGIDTALQLGLNFPRGPFASARRHGVSEVLAELCRLQAAAPAPLKARYAASPGLLALQ